MNKRAYRLGKRGASREETRRRIVEAAIALHSSLGPARTSVSQIAERAGVQRHTYYAHFPEERDLYLACSGLSLERDPLPDPEAWAALPAGRERLAAGIGAFYQWYARNHQQAACVTRDAEHHPLTREMMELRFAPVFARAAQVLGEGLSERASALVWVAFEFATYRSLARQLTSEGAAQLMADAIASLRPA